LHFCFVLLVEFLIQFFAQRHEVLSLEFTHGHAAPSLQVWLAWMMAANISFITARSPKA